jgi:hypothetical protein
MKEIRTLRADEIECRAQSLKEGRGAKQGQVFAVMLLYKDARCDMNILDETFGPENWQRDHKEVNGNLFGGVGVWDEDKKVWIWKWDAGAESNTEAEKGHASDSFKRACFNLGIGRELYTSPFIYMQLEDGEYYMDGSKPKIGLAKFHVSYIAYGGKRQIVGLVIQDSKGKERFKWGAIPKEPDTEKCKGFQTVRS